MQADNTATLYRATDADSVAVSRRPFLFIDGEGANMPDGSHAYMLLAAWSEYTGPMILRNEDDSPLNTVQCLEWILNLSERLQREKKPHVISGFGFRYDTDMILKQMPRTVATLFRTPERYGFYDPRGMPRFVPWYGYRFRQQGSQFMITDATVGIGASYSQRTKDNRRTATIWDVWRFFQGSFVRALSDWRIISADELERMQKMKERRSSFDYASYCDPLTRDEITRYCLSECESGVRLMTKLDDTCAELGFPLMRFDGAGSLAAAMMKAWDISAYMEDVPEPMQEAVSCAYFGGRFEVGVHGRVNGRVWQNDINSAYPYQIARLPCLAHASWSRSVKLIERGLYRVRWDIPRPCRWGPFPNRADSGAITFPRIGSGWYWGSEIIAARKLYPTAVTIIEGWRIENGCDHLPFSAVPDVYLERQRLGKSEAGTVLKLGLNSLYGKMAQSIGSPRYANYIWAGMVTAGCRAMILDAIREAGTDHVLSIATDSVLTDQPVQLPASPAKRLGEWSEETAANGVLLIQPGISITYGEDAIPHYKTRGIGKKEFAAHADAAEEAWRNMGVLGSFSAITHRFIGLQTAIARNRYEQRCSWVDVRPRLTYLPGNKRWVPDAELTAFLHERPTYSEATEGSGERSVPYRRLLTRMRMTEFDEAQFISEQPAIESALLQWMGVMLDAA